MCAVRLCQLDALAVAALRSLHAHLDFTLRTSCPSAQLEDLERTVLASLDTPAPAAPQSCASSQLTPQWLAVGPWSWRVRF
jgi:hypothetical protein